ncbi:hypothetical protein BDY17DRAFT_321503 [Neohortaea acidophila]|uniref:Uncharacterized protein n=1 Tax=Neohortaea acidophila TaxID=245834 RepID=A0A6A6Q422_9PEZI|nr:uncharacterized protein BDY17DRAFT_321503 [Neohortaea acidophila]KAF2486734.1 hypothetical protein BDY17DRAFT_321503 [Neohortaea acidophila]
MSALLKFASIGSAFSLFGASALYSMRNSSSDFSRNALALEHTGEAQTRGIPKPKVPSNFLAISIGGYEIKTAA